MMLLTLSEMDARIARYLSALPVVDVESEELNNDQYNSHYSAICVSPMLWSAHH